MACVRLGCVVAVAPLSRIARTLMIALGRDGRPSMGYSMARVVSLLVARLARTWASLALNLRVKQCGGRLRAGTGIKVFGGENIALGDDVSILGDATLSAVCGELRIGDRVALNRHVHIDASQGGRIEIGPSVLIGPNVVLRASDHSHDRMDIPIRDQGHTGGWIVVEEGVWLAANVVVTKNVRIGANSIVAAGAVVVKDAPPFSVVAGVPARVVRSRKEVQRG